MVWTVHWYSALFIDELLNKFTMWGMLTVGTNREASKDAPLLRPGSEAISYACGLGVAIIVEEICDVVVNVGIGSCELFTLKWLLDEVT